ncbi:hypothetical protein NDU88_004967 [Pleurodeles waltl]|uniref:Uncharacterized protein n=1 Tax=Pleurodeles waltl TaxID=8319 RepID=A0AAV7KZC1_PLEWA|nr:hypothetical protein NDU88_004967 [Pleurodeles waltl]
MASNSSLDMHGPQPTAIYDSPADHCSGPVGSHWGSGQGAIAAGPWGSRNVRPSCQIYMAELYWGPVTGVQDRSGGPPPWYLHQIRKYNRPPEPDWLHLDLTAPEAQEDQSLY